MTQLTISVSPQQWCPRPFATCPHLHRCNSPIHNRCLRRVTIRHGRLRIRRRDHHRPAGGTSPIHLCSFCSAPSSNPNFHLNQKKSYTRPTYAHSPHPPPSQRAYKMHPPPCNSPTSTSRSHTPQPPPPPSNNSRPNC